MDYTTLSIIWFILITVLFCGYVVLDGFDLGVGMIHFNAKTDEERRIMLNSIGPVWDGNEVWLLTGGGAIFAAFPMVYATVFSGFYTALMLFLLMVIARAVSIEFRSKVEASKWRNIWDLVFNISSYLIALLLGVALGNIISGVPLDNSKEFAGTFFGLLHPYALLVGLTAVVLLRVHGMIYASIKTDGDLKERISKKITRGMICFIVLFIPLTILTVLYYPYMMGNFVRNTHWFVFPLLTFVSIIMVFAMNSKKNYKGAFIFSSAIILTAIVNAAIGIFPNLVRDAVYGTENSLTIFNACSSEKTLNTMFIIACIGVPIVLVYFFVIYRVFRGKVTIDKNSY